jgi:MFS-type transporter involved in bile tolerance (Atg22 family)
MSSIFGPLLFGGISAATGNQRLAVLALGLFLALGGNFNNRKKRSPELLKL